MADGNLRRDSRNGVPGGLACQRRRARHARVDFNDVVVERVRVYRQLHVAAPLDAERINNAKGSRAQQVILHVAQGLAGSHHDAVAGVDAHRVQVLHVADGDDVAQAVAHDFVLDLLPSQQTALDHQLAAHRELEALAADFPEFVTGRGHTAAGAAQGVSRPHNAGIGHDIEDGLQVGFAFHNPAFGHGLAEFAHQRPEEFAVFRLLDRFQRGAEELDVVLFQDSQLRKLAGEVEAGLAAQSGEQAVGALPGNHALAEFGRQRLDVNPVRRFQVRHDRGGVGIDENDFVALFAEAFAGLRARVVELGGLSDDDRSAPDHEDFAHGVRALFYRPGG